jgi:hypothetical protein
MKIIGDVVGRSEYYWKWASKVFGESSCERQNEIVSVGRPCLRMYFIFLGELDKLGYSSDIVSTGGK